jgi:hypothetical protein
VAALAAGIFSPGGIQALAQSPQPPKSGIEFQSVDVRALQADEFANPAMLWVTRGEVPWSQKRGAAGDTCASCHGDARQSMRGVAVSYPKHSPALGRVVARLALVRFTRMLGTLVGSGVPLVASLRTAREALGNQTLADTVTHAIEEVQRGSALSRALAASPVLFPASVVEMVAVAEETGRLDKELVRLSISYEADLERRLRILVALAEPLLLFVMAAVIGTVVVGMLLPVFMLQDLVK